MSKPKDPAEYMASLFEDDDRPDPTKGGTTTGGSHPDTSHEAAVRVWPKTGTQRAKILQLLYNLWPGGLTDEEIQDRTGMGGSSERPRRIELTGMGWVINTLHTRETHGGDQAIIWQYKPAEGEKV